MKCPCTVGNTTQFNVNRYSYDEDGNITKHVHRLNEQHELTECLQEECVAWEGGNCQYRGAVN